jgi:hypothetical protein
MVQMPQFNAYHQRTDIVLPDMMRDFYAQKYPFVAHVMVGPQQSHRLPPSLPRGGVEEANYFLYVCNYMLGPTDSMTIADQVASMYEQTAATLFNPRVAANMTPKQVSDILLAANIGFRSKEINVPKAWIFNSELLVRDWDGDIRNVIAAAGGDWRELHRLLMHFAGFGPKMASLLPFFLMRNGLVPYFLVPPQVDFHVMRVFWSTNLVLPLTQDGRQIVRLEARGIARFAEAIRLELVRHLLKTGQNWLDLSEALWTQSREMCRLSPSNTLSKSRDGSEMWQNPLMWTKTERQNYDNSCGRCAIAPHCTGAIPQAPYYRKKKLKELWLYGPRQTPQYERNPLFNPD